MTSPPASTSAVLEHRLRDAPDALRELTAAHEAARSAVDRRLLELCRLRVAVLLGTPGEADSDVVDPHTIANLSAWPTSDLFDATDRACLAFTEQFVIDVAALSDDLADAVSAHLGPQGFVDFVHALLVIEQRQRLRLIWGRLFEEAGR